MADNPSIGTRRFATGGLAAASKLPCINGWFAGNAKIKAKTAEICHCRSDDSQPMSPFQPSLTVLCAEAGADRDTHHSLRRMASAGPGAALGRTRHREPDALLPIAAFNVVD
jgi:hypothetical protein